MRHHTRDRSSVPIFVGVSLVGCVHGRVFCKKIKGSKHFLLEPRAIAFARASLEDAERAGAHRLEVLDIETGCIYRADLAYFKEHSFEFQRAGFELQRALRLEYWTLKGKRRRRTKSTGAAPAGSIAWRPHVPKERSAAAAGDVEAGPGKFTPVQLGLFGIDHATRGQAAPTCRLIQ